MGSSYTSTVNTDNQQTNQYSTEKVFIGDNSYETVAFKSAGTDQSLVAGQLMGRVSATGFVTQHTSGASDGSEIPFGILAESIEITAGETPNLSICVKGRVDKNLVVLSGSDTFATVVSSRRIDDRINGDTVGIELVDSTEMTIEDND